MVERKCSPECKFFPHYSFERINYLLKKGVKFAPKSNTHICDFDDHPITCWEKCKNFKTNKKNKLIVLCGKSATGKDTVLNYLVDTYHFDPIVSVTTRPKREKEIEGKDYYFSNLGSFLKKQRNDEFLETRIYNTFQNGKKTKWFYGIEKEEFNKKIDPIAVVDFSGYTEIEKYYGKENIVLIYIDTYSKLRELRAKNRGSFEEKEWNRRKQDDEIKFTKELISKNADYIVENNGTKEQLFSKIDRILKLEKII